MMQIKIQELVSQTMAELRERGYKPTVLKKKEYLLLRIVKFHKRHDMQFYSPELLTAYQKELAVCREKCEITLRNFRNLSKAAEQLAMVHNTGTIIFTSSSPKDGLPDYYEGLRNKFLSCENFNEKSRKQMHVYARSFFTWLVSKRCETLNAVDETVIKEYLFYCSERMTKGSLVNVKRFLKKACTYWYEQELLPSSYENLLSFTLPVEKKVKPAIPQSEIAATLNTMNRDTAKGRRDYAIMLLATVCGLRPIDIVNLKLKDIDWRNGEIRIIQTKTKKALATPLTTDVGTAIQNYILNCRPVTELEYVFLTLTTPVRKLNHSVPNMQNQRYRTMAGLSKNSFHGLRRALGSNMAAAGIPVTTIAQTLGHSMISSTKQYISLNSKQLKECALDFMGIEPKRGVL